MKQIIPNSIHIEHTKGIDQLTFSVPSRPGVYLLVAPNGSGKTTILTALHRICESNAFFLGFRTASENEEIDRYADSAITYTSRDSKSVTFRKRESRWVSTPKTNSDVLSSFGFKSASFIKADPKRLSPSQEEIRTGSYVPAPAEIKQAMNRLFATDKYDSLKKLRNALGRGKSIQFYVIQDKKKNIYSEKRFSTGELAILRLVEKLTDIPQGSMLLLDEAELALHPSVQLRLLDYLREMSHQKKLSIFVSTHSTSMIRATSPANIMLLDAANGKAGHFRVVNPCYPAYAMGLVDELDNNAPDALICVEDDMACSILHALMQRFLNLPENARLQHLEKRIIPVGGYLETLRFIDNASRLLFRKTTRLIAVLDNDVFDEDEKGYAARQRQLAEYQGRVFNLGVTPEQAIIEVLEQKPAELMTALRNIFHIKFESLSTSSPYLQIQNDKPRAAAKKKLELLCREIMQIKDMTGHAVCEQLITLTLPYMYTDEQVRQYLKPIFNAIQKPAR